MAKQSGSTRVSHWGSDKYYNNDMYMRDGYRSEYKYLTPSQKKIITAKKDEIASELKHRLIGTTITKYIGDGENANIGFSSAGIDHLCNDAMVRLSGKYMSESSMLRMDEIFAKAQYIDTPHTLSKPRKDGRELWFTYKDAEGRGIYFKADYNKNMKMYELYTIVDTLEPKKRRT